MADSNVSSEIPVNITLERSLFVGIILRGILYGVEVSIFFASVYCISHRPSNYRKRQKFYIVYGAILLALITIQVAFDAMWGTFMWISHRNYPGGPLGFYGASEGTWYNAMTFAANSTGNILANGLLVYRYAIICGFRWRILVLPILMYVASSVFLIVMVVLRILQHHAHTFILHGKPIHPLVPLASLSVGLNVIITSMICFRILRVRALTREVRPELCNTYTSIATMLIESAAPYTILGIWLVILAAENGPLVDALCFVWSVFCSLSSQMIILRVAMGRGWVKETANEFTTALEFAQPVTLQEQSQGECMTTCTTIDPVSSPGTPVNRSDTSTTKDMSTMGVVSLV